MCMCVCRGYLDKYISTASPPNKKFLASPLLLSHLKMYKLHVVERCHEPSLFSLGQEVAMCKVASMIYLYVIKYETLNMKQN